MIAIPTWQLNLKVDRLFTLALLVFFSTATPFRAIAQDSLSQHYQTLLPDQIYLQTTNIVYAAGTTLWFKVRVADAVTQQPAISRVLYVELISPLEEIVEKKVVKIDQGAGSGFFDLGEELEAGRYLIRAYSKWNVNFGPEYFFRSYVNIINPETDSKKPLIERVTLTEQADSSYLATAYVNAEIKEQILKQSLRVVVSQGDQIDSLSIRRLKKDDNEIAFNVGDQTQPFTIKIYDKGNQLLYARSHVSNVQSIGLKFFPENGQLVEGIPSSVTIRATDNRQNNVPVQGQILNENNQTIAGFVCQKSGLGSVYLPNRPEDGRYKARFTYEGQDYEYLLPAIQRRGSLLSMRRSGENILLIVKSNTEVQQVYLSATAQGIPRLRVSRLLENGQLATKIAGADLPYGIILFEVKDGNGQLLAYRYYFNHLGPPKPNAQLTVRKGSNSKRAKTSLEINMGATFASNNTSILVVSGEELTKVLSERSNLQAYTALNAHFKREITASRQYLQGTLHSKKALDALLLTMTPQDYWYQTGEPVFNYLPETSLNVTGSVKDQFTGKAKAGIGLIMMTFGDESQVNNQVTDEAGRFYFPVADHYQSAKRILLQSSKKKGANKDFDIEYDAFPSPAIYYDHTGNLALVDSVVMRIQDATEKALQVDKAFRLSTDVTILDEFVVEDYKITPQRTEVAEKYGKPQDVIDGDEMVEKEEKWMYGLYSLLQSKYDDKIIVYRVGNDLYARVRGGGLTLVIVDGKPLQYDYYNQLAFLQPSDLSSVDIIKGAKNFIDVARITFPKVPPGLLPAAGSLIAIYTKAGKGFFGMTRKAKGINHHYVSGFSPMKIYQSLSHENTDEQTRLKPDLRSVLHWEPGLTLNASGKAELTFYNSDVTGKVLVILEAVDKNGKVIYEELTYEVK